MSSGTCTINYGFPGQYGQYGCQFGAFAVTVLSATVQPGRSGQFSERPLNLKRLAPIATAAGHQFLSDFVFHGRTGSTNTGRLGKRLFPPGRWYVLTTDVLL